MAQDRPRKPERPEWKAAAGPPKAAARGPKYAWKPQEIVAPSQWGRRVKLAGATFGALGCLAVVIVMIYWLWPHKGACLVIVGADPRADVERLDVPLDAYGWRGGKRLAEWSVNAATEHTPQLPDANQINPESFDNLEALLQKLEGQRRETLIVYLGLHGGADQTGPFLFTAGGKRLYLRDLIDGFKRPRLKDKNVVLLIDPARLAPDAALGVLHPDCVRALKALEAEKIFDEVPKLIVMCANDAGERGWSAEEWGTTGFAEMVLRGLSGGAHATQGDVITALNLFDFVKNQTQSWSQDSRMTAQTPILLPETGGRQRAEKIKLTATTGDRVGDWPEAQSFEDSMPAAARKSLLEHWTRCKELEDGTPSPAVYTPRLWRRYRELLLRYEYLLRAREVGAADKLAERLTRAEQELNDGRGLRLADGQPKSGGNDLPLTVALGFNTPASDVPTASDAPFNHIWAAPDGDRIKLWDELVKAPGAKPTALRAAFYDYLLKRATAATSSRADIDKAARLMDLSGLKDAGVPRPAEAHLLVMTRAFFADPRSHASMADAVEPLLDLWKRALVVRLLAERAALGINSPGAGRPAHPYSEQLWPWIAPTVEAGDNRRRDGEDWLFSSQPNGHDRASVEIETAAKTYDDVLRQAKSYQAAFATRDEALADLPLLTRWIAAEPAKPNNERVEALKKLWIEGVHPLARRLDGGDRPSGIERLTEDVHQGFARYQEEYRAQCRGLRNRDLTDLREQVEQVLSVPFMLIEPDVRWTLLANSSRLVAKLSGQWVLNPKRFETPATDGVNAARRLQTLQWGELAAAVLGDIPKDQRSDSKGNLFSAEGLRTQLATLPADKWEAQADTIGDQIGRHWQLLGVPTEAERQRADDSSPVLGPAQAEFRSRWASAFGPTDEPEPATVNRHKRWQSLFVSLARRTAIDHWYYEVEGRPTEYFRAAADLYLSDAKQVVDGSAAAPGAGQVTELLKPDLLRLEPVRFEQRVPWTSEVHRTLTFEVQPKGGLNGYITLWPDIGKSPVLSLSPDDLPRQPVPVDGARRDLHVVADRSATTDNDSVKLTTHGYFRGKWLIKDATINLNRTPELIVARAKPPNDAAVAVRGANNLDLGAIAIVLDFSGSMADLPPPLAKDGRPRRDWRDKTSKNQQAIRTLRDVLLGLPKGTPISLRLFGHKYEAGAVDGMPEGQLARLTIDELFYPETARRGTGRVVWSRDDPEPLEAKLLRRLETTEPNGHTPLLRTMEKAKRDFPPDFKGPKTLLVLTDGMDNLYSAEELKEKLLAEFANENITIEMFFFRVDEDESKKARAQFADIEDAAKFRTPGRITVVAENSKLGKEIELALRPKLQLLKAGSVPANGMGRDGLRANRPADDLTALRWTPGIDPGQYTGQVFQSEQPFKLYAGDRMLVHLTKGITKVRFTRDLLADEPWLKDRGRVNKTDDWALGLPNYRARPTGQDRHLLLTATIESRRDQDPGTDGYLQQTRPAFQWWDVAAPTGERPTKLRVEERSQFWAPAWTMIADGWPGGLNLYKPAKIRAWASLDPPPAAYKRMTINLAALAAGEAVSEEVGEEGKVRVFASLEERPLRVDTKIINDFQTADPPATPCLVIRILHPPGKPVFVHPVGIEFDAYEQRYYPSSAAVTAVFGPALSKEDLEARLQGQSLELDLISVDRFKTDHKPLILNLDPAVSDQPWLDPPNLGKKADKTP